MTKSELEALPDAVLAVKCGDVAKSPNVSREQSEKGYELTREWRTLIGRTPLDSKADEKARTVMMEWKAKAAAFLIECEGA